MNKRLEQWAKNNSVECYFQNDGREALLKLNQKLSFQSIKKLIDVIEKKFKVSNSEPFILKK